MADFTKTKYYHQYIEACTELNRAKERLKDLKEEPFYTGCASDPAEIAAAEKECKELQEKVDDLWCLYLTGEHRQEQAATPPKCPYGPFNTGHHENPNWRLPR